MGALINLSGLFDEAKCPELVRQMRGPGGVQCPHCGDGHVAHCSSSEFSSTIGARMTLRRTMLSSLKIRLRRHSGSNIAQRF